MPETVLASNRPGFRRDLQEVIAWSEERFGVLAADHYALSVQQALRDVLEEPTRPGAKARPDLASHDFIYHLKSSRGRVVGQRLIALRHFLLCRYLGEMVEFAQLLYDGGDLARHVPAEFRSK